MNAITSHLAILLMIFAAMQACIACLNLALVRIMHWETELARMDTLVREVHCIHSWFLSLTLGIFAVLTWKFSTEMAAGNNTVCVWLAGGIGIFWAIRAILQVTYYSASHWRGRPGRTFIHILLLAMYTACAATYLLAAFSGGK